MHKMTSRTAFLLWLVLPGLVLVGLAGPVPRASGSVTFVRHGVFEAGDGPTDAVAADFDEDGDLDVAVGNITELGGGVSVLFNDGHGGLGGRRLESLGGVVVGPDEVKLADFDRDGHVDITAVADDIEVEVLFGDGTGRFEQHGFRAGEAPRGVAPLDLNDDGLPDLAVANPSENAIFVLRNNGARGFGSPIKFPVTTPRFLAAADLDGDGDEDLVATGSGRTHVLVNNAGLLSIRQEFESFEAKTSSPVFAHFDDDGRLDLAFADGGGGAQVLLNQGSAQFAVIGQPVSLGRPQDVDGGDLDGDGDVDVVVVSRGDEFDSGTDDFVTVLLNDGTGHLSTGPRFAAGTNPRGVAVAHLDGDRRLDLAVTATGDDQVATFVNRTPPLTASAGPDVSGTEGSPISLAGTATEGGAVTWRVAPVFGTDAGAGCSFSDSHAAATTITCTDDGTYRATITAAREFQKVADDVVVTVANARPTVENLAVTGGQAACLAGNDVRLSFRITDPGINDTHRGSIDWGDGSPPESFTGSTFGGGHGYAPGRYTIGVQATDDDGGQASVSSPGAVSLLFNRTGFLAPVSMDGSSTFQLGRKVPVKIQVTDCQGTPVDTLHPDVDLTKLSSEVSGTATDVSLDLTADEGDDMRFDPSSGQYVFTLATRNSQFCTTPTAMCNGADLTPGTYQLKVTDASFEPVVTTIQISAR
jgi:hypothetical protein